ncbi:hypothetical protein FGG08_004159 [Glutinoglossum americanum]|uniref:Bacteriophage T5 Orf172 DNA-binding domain-containing protein n=1 Tax=Glutinoglossum americanum TaxID=1670608 RepID=A0A9P8I868_9PEZI|nr:hypothetical protein FGG08_004159 [Glutinoglossum americanum]
MPCRDRPISEFTSRRATSRTSPGGSSPEPVMSGAARETVSLYDSDQLDIHHSPSSDSPIRHTRSKSCGIPEPRQPAMRSEAAGLGATSSGKRELRMSRTPGQDARTHARAKSCSGPETPSSRSTRLYPSDTSYWNFSDHNFPGVYDVVSETRCIGSTTKYWRCKLTSKCASSASLAIEGIRGLPSVDILEDVAKNLLCGCYHQNQKRKIAETWLEKLTRSPESPESTQSQDDNGFWGTPESRSCDLATPRTTPSPSRHSKAAPEEDRLSPAAARHHRIAERRPRSPESLGTRGRSMFSKGSSSKSDRASVDDPLDFGFLNTDECRTPEKLFIHYFGPVPSGGHTEGLPSSKALQCPQSEDDVFTRSSGSPTKLPELSELALADGRQARPLTPSVAIESDNVGRSVSGLEELTPVLLSGQHKRWAGRDIEYWRSKIPKTVDSVDHPEPDSRPKSPSASKILGRDESPIGRQPDMASGRLRQDSYTCTAVNMEFIKTDADNPEIGNFKGYYPREKRNTVSIRDSLVRPLTPRELLDGYVYIYWYPGNFGYLKIGVTGTKGPHLTVAKRLAGWKRSCGRTPLPIYPKPLEESRYLPHVYRIEALVKAEFRQHRKKSFKCQKCGKQHNEWFEVSPQHAVAVVEKWSSWMAQRPYEETLSHGYKSKDRGTLWNLKEMPAEELDRISHIPEIVTKPQPKKETPQPGLPSSVTGKSTSSQPLRRSSRLAEKQRKSALTASQPATTEAESQEENNPTANRPSPYLFLADSRIFQQTQSTTPLTDSPQQPAQNPETS